MSCSSSDFIYMENICKKFGKSEVLKNVTVKIARNKITSVVGDNGSGKSTLIKIMSGTLKPSSGSIYIEGKHYTYLTTKIAIIMVSQLYIRSLDNFRDAVGNIFLGMEITKYGFILDYKEMNRQTEKLLQGLNINIPYTNIPVGYLSGGQRQSIAIARYFPGKNSLFLMSQLQLWELRNLKQLTL